jgi:succinyl-diaminopimelate desuccinylase
VNKLEDTLAQLVDIPSVTGSEGRICTFLAERLLAEWGLDGVRRIGNSLVVGARMGRPLITLYGHTDTVPEQQGNGTARTEGDLMYGLGTSDMKSGVAVMVHLLEDAAVRHGPYDVIGVFYDKEEGPADLNGLGDVLDRAPWLEEAEFSVVMEPTNLDLELGCNGVMNATAVFTGKAAHSARPWLGENAVTKAGALLDALHRREPEVVEVAGLEFREVFSVTKAAGGIASNVLPSRFELNVNYRFPPTYDLDAAEARLRDVLAAADEIHIVDRAPAGTIDEANPHLARLEAVAGGERAGKQGWTDVARLTSRGIAAVNYGPGLTAQAHQVGEHVPIANLYVAYQKLREFLTT